MRKFAFGLEPVLNLKRRREDSLLEELGRRQRALKAAEEALRGVAAERRQAEDDLRMLLLGRIDLGKVRAARQYLAAVERRLACQRRECERRAAEVQACRQDLVAAQKERKTFEKLRQRQWEAYQEDFRREEQSFLDELAAQEYGRQR
ncbi:MAG TPA: flagellar export protein FliJ [Firmicutes bacterium]|nr:flagellar export protein FliJ [Bacillota bacterium]